MTAQFIKNVKNANMIFHQIVDMIIVKIV
jgi:hypothetical protein